MRAVPGPVRDIRMPLIRRATLSDSELLWRWANDPDVRSNSFHPEPIPRSSHEEWLSERLRDEATAIWIMEDHGAPVGQVRYDRDGDAAEVDVSIARESRGGGYGVDILLRTAQLACDSLDVHRLVALVVAGNERSRRAFLRAGYAMAGTEERHGRRVWRFERLCPRATTDDH